MVDKIAHMSYKCKLRNGEEVPYGGQRERLQGGPGPAAAAHPLQEGQSGNPGGRSTRSLPALLADAINETVVATIDGRRRKLTKRAAIVTQMVDKSASADLRSTKCCST
jgi:hypothetical protein